MISNERTNINLYFLQIPNYAHDNISIIIRMKSWFLDGRGEERPESGEWPEQDNV
jgi:hypothetical protein